MYKKAWCTCKVVVLLLSKPIAFLPFSLPSPSLRLSSLLLSPQNFASMVTWRHTSPLYRHAHHARTGYCHDEDIKGSLRKGVFERHMTTGRWGFFSFNMQWRHLLWSVFTLTATICCAKPQPKTAKSPLPVKVCPSKTPLIKLPVINLKNVSAFINNIDKVCKCGDWVGLN